MNELKILRTTNQKVEQLEADIKQLREEVHDLKNKTKPEDITNVVLKETIERKLRANNFIIFGSPDSNTASTMEKDVTLAKDIIIATTKDIDKKNTVAKVFRLGKFNQNKPRPIKVICTSSELVSTALRNSKNLKNTPNFAGLYISNDKTRKQLEEYNLVKSQLIGRTKGGESNLRIKYINGHPTIVSSAGSVNLKYEILSNRDDNISIIYQNVRGLNTKTQLFYEATSFCIHDIIAITESWLQPGVNDGELFPPYYTVYRKDRNLADLNVSRGGGALIAVRDPLMSSRINLSILEEELPAVDVVAVKIIQGDCVNFIFAIYFQPNSPPDHYIQFFDYLETLDIFKNGKILILGDFNIDFQINENPSPKLQVLLNYLAYFELNQFNMIKNKFSGILDLAISNIPTEVFRGLPIINEDDYHPTLLITINIKPSSNLKNFPAKASSKNYNFRLADYHMLYDLILTADWEFDPTQDADSAIADFYAKLHRIFDKCIPYHKPRNNKYAHPPWHTKEIIQNIKRKFNLFRTWKRTRSQTDYNAFRELRSTIKHQIGEAYNNYIRTSQESLLNDPKQFWKFIRQSQAHTRIPGSMTLNETLTNNPQEIVDAFAKFFQSVYIKSASPHLPYPTNINYNSITLPLLTEQDTLVALKQTKNKPTAGSDNIPAFVLRDCAAVFAGPLTYLFNLSIKSGVFPTLWKTAKICPVLKSGEAGLITNYRPISILSNFSKIFEMCIYNKLFVQIKQLITTRQHGFFSGRSTITNLTCFTEYLQENINRGHQIDVIYTDFSKAFDKLDHGIISSKMLMLGFDENLIRFFSSYLSDRQQFVQYNGYKSFSFYATSGAPQGSNLAPLIFSIFINDISLTMKNPSLMFADDLKIYAKIISPDDCTSLQQDLDNVNDWCLLNKLPLNISKCKKITYSLKQHEVIFQYSINNIALENCTVIKDLGVNMDKKLSFNCHISIITQSAFKTLGFVFRSTRQFTDINCLITLYRALVLSGLEYASQVWSPLYITDTKKLESVQRRFLKGLVYRADGVYPEQNIDNTTLLYRFNFLSLKNSRSLHGLLFLYKLCNGGVDCPWLLNRLNFNIPSINTRTYNPFYLETPRTNLAKKAPLFRICNTYNDIHSLANLDLFHDSFSQYKDKLLNTLRASQFDYMT